MQIPSTPLAVQNVTCRFLFGRMRHPTSDKCWYSERLWMTSFNGIPRLVSLCKIQTQSASLSPLLCCSTLVCLEYHLVIRPHILPQHVKTNCERTHPHNIVIFSMLYVFFKLLGKMYQAEVVQCKLSWKMFDTLRLPPSPQTRDKFVNNWKRAAMGYFLMLNPATTHNMRRFDRNWNGCVILGGRKSNERGEAALISMQISHAIPIPNRIFTGEALNIVSWREGRIPCGTRSAGICTRFLLHWKNNQSAFTRSVSWNRALLDQLPEDFTVQNHCFSLYCSTSL